MKEFKFIANKIEVRSSEQNKKPRYIVRGTAVIPNKKHVFEYEKQNDGTFKTKKSMFTDNFIQSVKKQAKSKRIFIDTQHELVRDASIKAMVKGKVTPQEEKQLSNMLDRKKLPLAKLNNIEIKDNRLEIETEFNPMFREVDNEHKNYFDAVWYSLENKYLDGISINMTDMKVAKDDKGDLAIDDATVLGFSILDGAAEGDNSITEVAIRALEEGISIREGDEKMKEDEKKLAEEKAKLEEDKKKFEEEKAAVTQKAEEQKKKEEADAATKKEADIKAQEEELKKTKEELAAKTEEAKKATDELNSAKGTVAQTPPPAQASAAETKGEEFVKEKMKVITKRHDDTIEIHKKGQHPMVDNSMKGFGEAVNLARADNLTAGLSEKDAEFVKENRLLDKGGSDIIVPRKTK